MFLLGIAALFLASIGFGLYIATKRWKPRDDDSEKNF